MMTTSKSQGVRLFEEKEELQCYISRKIDKPEPEHVDPKEMTTEERKKIWDWLDDCSKHLFIHTIKWPDTNPSSWYHLTRQSNH